MENTRLKNKRWSKRLVAPLAAIAALAAVSAVAIADPTSGGERGRGDPGRPPDIDPVYNVCRGVDPDCYSDWGPFQPGEPPWSW